MANAPAANPLALDIEHDGNKTIVRCHGRIVSGNSGDFYAKVRPLLEANKHLILDLSDVAQVDSSGLGTFVRLYVSSKTVGATIELVNLGKQIRELLGLTDLLHTLANMGEQGIIPRF